jgi:hypothetical protein
MGLLNWAENSKGTDIRTLCQKIQRSIEAQQRPTKMDSRTIYRTLCHLQTGIDAWFHMRKVRRGRWISHTCPLWLWGYSPFTVSSPGPVFYGAGWLLWGPQKQDPAVHSKCGIDKGLIQRGSTVDQWWSRCRGRKRPAPLYIHTYIRFINVCFFREESTAYLDVMQRITDLSRVRTFSFLFLRAEFQL